jgi:antirestriction protein ArdC
MAGKTTQGKTTQEVHEEVAAKIIAALENGVVAWRKPWQGHGNPVSGTQYRGINPLLLEMTAMANGYTDRRWLTYKGAQTLGGKIRKGEKGTTIVFWKVFRKEVEGVEKVIPMLRYFTVFCVEQCEGLELPPVGSGDALNPVEAADAIVAGYTDAPEMVDGGGAAWYRPSTDELGMPDRATFESAEAWYRVLFHEMAHSTGHGSRLDRDLTGMKGGEDYSREELVAEMTAAMLSGRAGILTDDSTEQSAAYIAGWKSVIAGDPGALVWAAGRAQKAADYIAGVRAEEPTPA